MSVKIGAIIIPVDKTQFQLRLPPMDHSISRLVREQGKTFAAAFELMGVSVDRTKLRYARVDRRGSE